MNGHHDNVINGDELVPLPSAPRFKLSNSVSIQPPLTRRGHGPGLIIVVPHDIDLNPSEKTLDPPPQKKWAEEGYAVAQILHSSDSGFDDFERHVFGAASALQKLEGCDSTEKLGVISYNVPFTSEMTDFISNWHDIAAIINYGVHPISSSKSQLWHLPGTSVDLPATSSPSTKIFSYPNLGPHFPIPAHPSFSSAPASVSHTRCLTFLKPLTGGPFFDLEAIWEEHTKFEFGERAVEKTMGTMVQEPYVNHIPTITGGIGRASLTDFYTRHFVFSNPEDTKMELVSRTVGVDRVIDEFVFAFTHDRVVDWILPGVPPTGKHVEIPFTGVINIRGDRLFHEHIGWDQATVLRQLGLLPEYLPFPYALPDGSTPAPGKRLEYRVPTAGVETARKLVDERSVESNAMFSFGVREVDI